VREKKSSTERSVQNAGPSSGRSGRGWVAARADDAASASSEPRRGPPARGEALREARSRLEGAGRGKDRGRTVLEHLQQGEGRDLDVLRGVHLRGVLRGAGRLAPHHAPSAHHSRDIHGVLARASSTRRAAAVARSGGEPPLTTDVAVSSRAPRNPSRSGSPSDPAVARLVRRHRARASCRGTISPPARGPRPLPPHPRARRFGRALVRARFSSPWHLAWGAARSRRTWARWRARYAFALAPWRFGAFLSLRRR